MAFPIPPINANFSPDLGPTTVTTPNKIAGGSFSVVNNTAPLAGGGILPALIIGMAGVLVLTIMRGAK